MIFDDFVNVFWGKESFNYAMEEDAVWDVEKYWQLELYLIKLCKHLDRKKEIDKELAKNIFFLSRAINSEIIWNRDSDNRLENYNEDEADYCLDRFNYLMRILWNAGNSNYENSIGFFEEGKHRINFN